MSQSPSWLPTVLQFPGMAAPKTSQSHPLQINAVGIPAGPGVIGLTFCPGKKGSGMYSGTWDRDLAIDLKAIRAFGTEALVTLMENHELTEFGVPSTALGQHVANLGMEWHYLPVRDVDVPDEHFEDLWTYSGQRLRRILSRGGKIVVHCLGGLGRTGTIAGRLLVEFGDQPEAAIKKVREARPGAIETSAQERYIRNCRPAAGARAPLSHEERALACLLGGAVGDAFGYEVEFERLPEIRARFGPAGIETPVLHHGKLIVSDDTQMTLFTLEGLLHCLKDRAAWQEACIPAVREAYLDWLRTQAGGSVSGQASGSGWLADQPQMRVRRAPGNTCLSALHSGGHGSIGKPINNSKGCGGAMRTAPIGLLPCADVDTVFRLAAEAAALTHGHPSGYLSAGMVAAIIRVLLDGGSLAAKPGTPSDSGAIDRCRGILKTYAGHEETLRAVDGAVQLAAKGLKDHAAADETLGGGWVGEEALAIALYAALSAESFVEAIKIATNHSGDSDSTAAIAGQLWGAANGLAGMPHDWISNADVLIPLLHVARQLTLSCYANPC